MPSIFEDGYSEGLEEGRADGYAALDELVDAYVTLRRDLHKMTAFTVVALRLAEAEAVRRKIELPDG